MSSPRSVISSTPSCAARARFAYGSYAMIVVSNAASRWANNCPMWPNPTMPMVFPKISTPVNSDRFQVCCRRVASAAGIWRAVVSSREIACSQAEWMFEVGALATMTPRSVAVAISTLSNPTPARPTIFRWGAASRTSRSTVVAERTRRASASLTALMSSGRLGPSTHRTSTWSPRASMVDCASLSAMRTTGLPLWLTLKSPGLSLEWWLSLGFGLRRGRRVTCQ